MFFTQSEQYESIVRGQHGRPDHYPEPEDTGSLMFFIQRNKNTNTVIYEANVKSDGLLDLNDPIRISWISFEENEKQYTKELNYIQEKLAYGCRTEVISGDLIRFRFVAYDKIEFFMARRENGKFKVYLAHEKSRIELKMIYIYAEDLGVFPLVKFAEFFGTDTATGDRFYKKLILE